MNRLNGDPRFSEVLNFVTQNKIPPLMVTQLFVANTAVAQHEEVDILVFWTMMGLMAKAAVSVARETEGVNNDPE